MHYGGLNAQQLKKIHAMANDGKPISVDRIKILIMNNKDVKTGKYYSEKEASSIADFIDKTYKSKPHEHHKSR